MTLIFEGNTRRVKTQQEAINISCQVGPDYPPLGKGLMIFFWSPASWWCHSNVLAGYLELRTLSGNHWSRLESFSIIRGIALKFGKTTRGSQRMYHKVTASTTPLPQRRWHLFLCKISRAIWWIALKFDTFMSTIMFSPGRQKAERPLTFGLEPSSGSKFGSV